MTNSITRIFAIAALTFLGGCVSEKGPTNIYIMGQSEKPEPRTRQIVTEERIESTTLIYRPGGQSAETLSKSSTCSNPSSDMAIFENRIRADLKNIGKSDSDINSYIIKWRRENNYLC